MGCDGLWSYLTNFVMRLKLEREKPSSPMYLPLYNIIFEGLYTGCLTALRCKPIYNKTLS